MPSSASLAEAQAELGFGLSGASIGAVRYQRRAGASPLWDGSVGWVWAPWDGLWEGGSTSIPYP